MLITDIHCALSLQLRLQTHGWMPKEGDSRGRGKGGEGEGGTGGRGKGRGGQMGKGEVIECCSIFSIVFLIVMTGKQEGMSKELVTGSQSFSNLANRVFALD